MNVDIKHLQKLIMLVGASLLRGLKDMVHQPLGHYISRSCGSTCIFAMTDIPEVRKYQEDSLKLFIDEMNAVLSLGNTLA